MRNSLKVVGRMSVLTEKGDNTLTWDPTETAEVDAVRTEFDKLIAANYSGFKVEGSEPGTMLKEFDSTATKIIMVPPMAGG